MDTPFVPNPSDVPQGDPTGQAVASLKGYAYQLYASALAWLNLRDDEALYLEVAQDYATAAKEALAAVQVKDTQANVTINSPNIRQAINDFVDLVKRNPGSQVALRFLTTSEIGTEQKIEDRAAGEPTLKYWAKAAVDADPGPLRTILERLDLTDAAKAYIKERTDEQLRSDLLRRISWDCGAPGFDHIRHQFDDRVVTLANERFGAPPSEAKRAAATNCANSCGLVGATSSTRSRRQDMDQNGLIDEVLFARIRVNPWFKGDFSDGMPMKVYDAVANAFVKEGTSTIFGLLGDGQLSWWSAIAKHPGVRIVDAREEGAGLAMAEGWAKATGKIGVCSVTHGPGLARLALSLIAAARSRTPIVVHTSKTAFNDERAGQFLNQDRFVSASEAGYIEVLTPAFAENAVRQAFYRARLESRPIVLCIPLDIQGRDCDSDEDEYQTSATLFAGQQRIRPDLDRLHQAVKIIAGSKRPVVLLGRGAMEPQARQAADRLAKRIGALIATTLVAKGVLGESEYYAGVSGQLSTRAAMQLFEEADCVIAIGAGLNARTIQGGYLYPNARVIHIDIAPHVLMGNDRSADCYIQGDAATTTQEIDDILAQQGVTKDGYRTAAVQNVLRGADRDPAEFEIEPGTVDPREAVRVLDDKLPSNVGLVTGSAHNFSFPVWHMKKPRPLQVCVNSFTGVGQVLANAIGVGVAVDEPVVAVDGDGSAMQNIQELDTAARLGLKLLYFIMNDEAYGAEYHKLRAKGRDGNLSVVRSPDLGGVGRAFGCRGRLARTLEDVAAGIDEFLAGDGPMVLDVRVSRNVISIPYRRLHLGQDV